MHYLLVFECRSAIQLTGLWEVKERYLADIYNAKVSGKIDPDLL